MTTRIAPSLLPPVSNWKKPVFFIAIASAVTAATAALFLSSTFVAVGYALLGLITFVFYREDGLTQRKVQQLTSQNEETVQRMNALNQQVQQETQTHGQAQVRVRALDLQLNQFQQALADQHRALTTANDNLTQETQRLNGENQNYVRANTALTQENQRLNGEHQQQVQANTGLTQANAALAQDNQRLNAESQQQAQANAGLTQENATLKRENKGLTQRNQALAAEYGILKHKTVQIESIAKDKESLLAAQESVVKGYEEAIAKSAAENKGLQEKNEDLTAVVETMKIEINRTSNANKALKLEVAGLNTKVHEYIHEKENSKNQVLSQPPLVRKLSDPSDYTSVGFKTSSTTPLKPTFNPYRYKSMGSTTINVVNDTNK